MRFGICTDAVNVETVKKIGYDYIELGVAELMPEQPAKDFTAVRERILKSGLQAEACNKFIPKGLPLVGPDADHARARKYIEVALARAAELGCEVVVFGSPHARIIPEGFAREKAFGQLVEIGRFMGEAGARNGVTIVLEPLEPKLTNTIHTVQDALCLCSQIKHRSVQVLADIYMMHVSGEPLESMAAAGKALMHVHASDPDRLAPGNSQHLEFHRHAAAVLKGMGYAGRVSVEARMKDVEPEAAAALQVMKQYYA